MYKCSLTHEKCGAMAAGFYDSGDSCPLREYKSSSRYYEPGEDEHGAQAIIDDTCRYYGIARAAELKNKKFMEG